tara:strand:+ start:323 stop:811 length:489 start_codon:yes stop_codon:yes gene_type:complete
MLSAMLTLGVRIFLFENQSDEVNIHCKNNYYFYSEMTKKIIYSEKAPKAIGPYSQAVQIENFLFLSGQIGLNPKTNKLENKNLQSELEQIMKNITSILNEANMTIENIIKTSVFMKDLSSFSNFNNIYKSFFKEKFPARETIEVSKLPMDARIEISIIAYKK